jgi:RNA polymerase sigma-70 factor (ECF subfamily)
VVREPASSERSGSPGTLGDLLYSDRSVPVIAEDEWRVLIESIAACDQHALRTLYERTHRLVFTLAFRVCNNQESAEEVTLDVFHDVWRRAADYDPAGGSVVGWIMNQARSRAIDRLRFEQRKKRVPPPDRAAGEEVVVADPAEVADVQQRRTRLREALGVLTADERRAIETAFFSELTYAETAARLEQPLGTIKTRVRSALAKLREALGEERGGP